MLADQDARSQGRRRGDDSRTCTAPRSSAYRSRELLERGDLEGYAELMHEHWQNKRERSPGMADERIDRLYDAGARAAARSAASSSAPAAAASCSSTRASPEDTRQAMAAAGAPELAFDFEFGGAYASEYA